MKQQNQPQPYSPHNPPVYSPDEEIVLREVLKAIWNGKLIVVLVTALFAVSSISFALLTQEWWSSTAKIAKAQPQDLTKYQQQVKQFQPVFDIYQDDGTVLISVELNNLTSSNALYSRFVDTFNSSNNKSSFLESSSEFQSYIVDNFPEKSEMVEGESRAFYAKWLKRVSAFGENKDDRNAPYFLKFQTSTKGSSFDLLTSYISYTESKVQQDAYNNLHAVVSGKRNELIQQKKILETQARHQLMVETERTKYAMGIALAAGVEKPIQTSNKNELFGIDLGSKGLQAKVQALESVKNLSVIEPRLQQVNAKLDMLSNLEINRNVEFQTFRYLENVEHPITRDQPKRALIVILGTSLGAVLGILMVLIRFFFRK